MKRAWILIITLTISFFGFGLWMDHLQSETARAYMRETLALRETLLAGRAEDARNEQERLQAQWQRDQHWMNCVVSHHHTRAIGTAMRRLSTAMEMGWDSLAIQALDEVYDALDDVARGDRASLENIL